MKKFEQNVIKSVKSVTVQKLPPTNSVAKCHSFRVYYQVQVWLKNETLQATNWGWELMKLQSSSYQNGYVPSTRSFNENYQMWLYITM